MLFFVIGAGFHLQLIAARASCTSLKAVVYDLTPEGYLKMRNAGATLGLMIPGCTYVGGLMDGIQPFFYAADGSGRLPDGWRSQPEARRLMS
jgi:hypothetical protein